MVSTIAVAITVAVPATAAALTGGAPTPAGAAPTPASPSGAPAADGPSAGTLSLLSARATPRKSYYYGTRYPSLRFTIGSDQPLNDLQVEVVDRAGATVRTYFRNDIAPDVLNSIRWDGNTDAGRPARNGHYSFRVLPQAGAPLAGRSLRRLRRARSSETGQFGLGFAIYGYAFPLLGAHDFGGSGAGFGAGRSGHTHQGQDVMARCGTPIVAARGGRVQYSGYQSAAGNYVVIDGKRTGYDNAYMHMLQPSPLKEGMTVRTGQPIGLVGSTGSSTACHLHFEIWGAPGWYEGGSPLDPLPSLKAWDRYS